MDFFLPFLDNILSKLGKKNACLEKLFSCPPFFFQFCRRNEMPVDNTGVSRSIQFLIIRIMHITAKAQGGRALIEIKGNISGWKDTEKNFTATVSSLIDSGIKDAHLYINSPGGDCFEANEIVNVIHKFPGKITGEGGAMVASAATYIAINCASFTMPENGMFMIHQPSGMAMGRKAEIESYLSLLEKISQTYYAAYLTKTTMKEEDFRKKWETGDFWMTAAEAKRYGFADEIGNRTQVTKATAQMIMEAGYTGKVEVTEDTMSPPSNKPLKNEFKMDLNAMLTQFGVAANTTESQFITMVGDWKRKAERVEMLERKEEERQDAEIETLLNDAILKKRITADVKEVWRESLKADIERGKKMIAGVPGVEKPKLFTPNKPSESGDENWEKLMDESPEALAKMEVEDPERYKALFDDYCKRNKV